MQVDVQLRKITAKTYFTWAAANALITNPCSPMKKVGFLPVIRHSVTNYSTGYSALRNFEEMTDIFHMPRVSLHCAEKYFTLYCTYFDKMLWKQYYQISAIWRHYMRSLL